MENYQVWFYSDNTLFGNDKKIKVDFHGEAKTFALQTLNYQVLPISQIYTEINFNWA